MTKIVLQKMVVYFVKNIYFFLFDNFKVIYVKYKINLSNNNFLGKRHAFVVFFKSIYNLCRPFSNGTLLSQIWRVAFERTTLALGQQKNHPLRTGVWSVIRLLQVMPTVKSSVVLYDAANRIKTLLNKWSI